MSSFINYGYRFDLQAFRFSSLLTGGFELTGGLECLEDFAKKLSREESDPMASDLSESESEDLDLDLDFD